jgi:DNA topoisomerase-1
LGDGITVNIGKFGQYIKQDNKSCSLTGSDNIFNITKERAEELLKGAKNKAESKVLGIHPRLKQEVQLAVGRYGQYIKCGNTNYRIPAGLRGGEITLDDAIKVIDNGK